MFVGLLHFQNWLEIPAVLSSEKMNKFLTSYQLWCSFWCNTNLEITKYNLVNGFLCILKLFFQLIVQILAFCKNIIMSNFDCSAISINLLLGQFYLLPFNLFSAVTCYYRFQVAHVMVASLWTNKTWQVWDKGMFIW